MLESRIAHQSTASRLQSSQASTWRSPAQLSAVQLEHALHAKSVSAMQLEYRALQQSSDSTPQTTAAAADQPSRVVAVPTCVSVVQLEHYTMQQSVRA